MGIQGTQLIQKAKARRPTKGGRGEPGRFVTLKGGRVIFLPAGKRTKWADVREKVLASQKREVASVERVKTDSVNNPRLVKFKDGSRGIFKSVDREAGSVEAETMTYELSQALGWDIVPETTAFELPDGERGSLQEFVKGGRSWVNKPGDTLIDVVYGMKRGEFEAHEGAAEMVVLDALVGNTDRHGGNILRKGKRLFAPDNDAAFGEWSAEVKYSTDPARDARVLIGDAAGAVRGRYVAPLSAVRRFHNSGKAQAFANRLDKALGGGVGETFMANVRSMAADDLLAWSAGIPRRDIGGEAWKQLVEAE